MPAPSLLRRARRHQQRSRPSPPERRHGGPTPSVFVFVLCSSLLRSSLRNASICFADNRCFPRSQPCINQKSISRRVSPNPIPFSVWLASELTLSVIQGVRSVTRRRVFLRQHFP